MERRPDSCARCGENPIDRVVADGLCRPCRIAYGQQLHDQALDARHKAALELERQGMPLATAAAELRRRGWQLGAIIESRLAALRYQACSRCGKPFSDEESMQAKTDDSLELDAVSWLHTTCELEAPAAAEEPAELEPLPEPPSEPPDDDDLPIAPDVPKRRAPRKPTKAAAKPKAPPPVKPRGGRARVKK